MDNNDYKKILDKLVNDEDYDVRRTVAKQGYGLDKLVNDEDWTVRKAVAEQGYGLDKLAYDENIKVRIIALNQLANNEKKDLN